MCVSNYSATMITNWLGLTIHMNNQNHWNSC